MKYIAVFLLFLLAVGASAQETRELTLKITNKKGKPVQGVVVQPLPNGDAGITDENGRFVFKSIAPDGSIRLFLPKIGETEIPIEGLDSILVVLRSSTRVGYYNARDNEELDIGYGTSTRDANTRSVSQLDAEQIVAQSSPRDLIDLLRGRVAGLDIAPDGTAKIRGTTSINLSSEPLVVLDGVAIGTLQDANSMVSVFDVKTISVLKEGSIYGVRGANGVILITTKK